MKVRRPSTRSIAAISTVRRRSRHEFLNLAVLENSHVFSRFQFIPLTKFSRRASLLRRELADAVIFFCFQSRPRIEKFPAVDPRFLSTRRCGTAYLVSLQRRLVAHQGDVDEGLGLQELMEPRRHIRVVVVPAQAVVLPGHTAAATYKKKGSIE